MSLIKKMLVAVAVVVAAAGSVNVFSQSAGGMTNGEIRKVDKSASKITIKHGEIKNLDMPPMTMVFTVKNAALLDQVKAGDKVKFTVVVEDGKMVVTDIQAPE